jgi:hypothetical protein
MAGAPPCSSSNGPARPLQAARAPRRPGRRWCQWFALLASLGIGASARAADQPGAWPQARPGPAVAAQPAPGRGAGPVGVRLEQQGQHVRLILDWPVVTRFRTSQKGSDFELRFDQAGSLATLQQRGQLPALRPWLAALAVDGHGAAARLVLQPGVSARMAYETPTRHVLELARTAGPAIAMPAPAAGPTEPPTQPAALPARQPAGAIVRPAPRSAPMATLQPDDAASGGGANDGPLPTAAVPLPTLRPASALPPAARAQPPQPPTPPRPMLRPAVARVPTGPPAGAADRAAQSPDPAPSLRTAPNPLPKAADPHEPAILPRLRPPPQAAINRRPSAAAEGGLADPAPNVVSNRGAQPASDTGVAPPGVDTPASSATPRFVARATLILPLPPMPAPPPATVATAEAKAPPPEPATAVMADDPPEPAAVRRPTTEPPRHPNEPSAQPAAPTPQAPAARPAPPPAGPADGAPRSADDARAPTSAAPSEPATAPAELAASPAEPADPAAAADGRMADGGPVLGLPAWAVPPGQVAARLLALRGMVQARPGSERAAAQLDLARYLLAQDRAPEARMVLAMVPPPARAPAWHALHAVAELLMGQADAAEALADPALDRDPEIALWRAARAAAVPDWPRAAAELARAGELLERYPSRLRQRLAPMLARIALVAAPDEARRIRRALAGLALPEHRLAELRLALAERQAGADEAAAAAPPASVDDPDSLLALWRGHPAEAARLDALARARLAAGDPRGALGIWTEARHRRPEAAAGLDLDRKMRAAFEDGIAAAAGAPLAAWLLWQEFPALRLDRAAGADLRRMLAQRLAALDLVAPAAGLYDELLAASAEAGERAELGAALAELRLRTPDPAAALAALAATESSAPLAPGLAERRARSRAQALLQAGRPADALAVLAGLDSPAAQHLRAEILWAERAWPELAGVLATLAGAAGPAADPELALRLALARGAAQIGEPPLAAPAAAPGAAALLEAAGLRSARPRDASSILAEAADHWRRLQDLRAALAAPDPTPPAAPGTGETTRPRARRPWPAQPRRGPPGRPAQTSAGAARLGRRPRHDRADGGGRGTAIPLTAR